MCEGIAAYQGAYSLQPSPEEQNLHAPAGHSAAARNIHRRGRSNSSETGHHPDTPAARRVGRSLCGGPLIAYRIGEKALPRNLIAFRKIPHLYTVYRHLLSGSHRGVLNHSTSYLHSSSSLCYIEGPLSTELLQENKRKALLIKHYCGGS